jgi:CheY-like chemotaxis protein
MMTETLRILCVDDNPETRRMLSFVLTRSGYDVITAEDGAQGIQKAKAWRPALILMDMMMPRMSGADAVRRLREMKVTKDIPILMLSAYHEQALVSEALASGADDYLIKTVLPNDLTEIIDKYLEIGSTVLKKESIRIRDESEESQK